LQRSRPTRRRHSLSLVLTDGQPSDIDVSDERLPITDAHQAVGELDRQGIFSYFISLDAQAAAYVNVKQPGFRAQKSIADNDVAMPRKEHGRIAQMPRSSTTPGASNFGWRADRAFECFMIRGGYQSCNDR